MQIKDINVTHDLKRKRFEIKIDTHTAELAYYINGDIIVFTHTGVPPALEGQGIGSMLVKTGLQYAKENNLKVESTCWFVSKYIDRHPEFRDLAE